MLEQLQLTKLQALMSAAFCSAALRELDSTDVPIIVALPWKWDETPDLSYITAKLPLCTASGGGGGRGGGAAIVVAAGARPRLAPPEVRAKGANLMVQRGGILHTTRAGPTWIRLAFPARPLASNSAQNIFEGLAFVPLLSWLHALANSSLDALPSPSRRRLPHIVFILSATMDQASSNVNLMNHTMNHFLAFNSSDAGGGCHGPQGLPPPPRVLFLASYCLCLAHQAQLCFKSQYARFGGWSNINLRGHKFITGVLGAAHIFAQATYFLRIFTSTMFLASQLRTVYPIEALALGIRVPERTEDEPHKQELVLYLLSWVLKVPRGRLAKKYVDAAQKVITILNTPWSRACNSNSPLFHVCDPTGHCRCVRYGRSGDLARPLQDGLRVLLLRQPTPGSESRWASICPNLAYFALWLVMHQLGAAAVSTSFRPPDNVAGTLEDMVAAGIDWSALCACRLSRAMSFLGHHDTLLHCFVAVITSHPLHRALYAVLKNDAKQHAEVAGQPAPPALAPRRWPRLGDPE